MVGHFDHFCFGAVEVVLLALTTVEGTMLILEVGSSWLLHIMIQLYLNG